MTRPRIHAWWCAVRPVSGSPRLAWHLSFWYPGLGQLYAAAWVKGAALLLLSTLAMQRVLADWPLATLWRCGAPDAPVALVVDGTALLIVWTWAVCDAERSVRRRVEPHAPAAARGERKVD